MILAVDPGANGGCVIGTCNEDAAAIPYPQLPEGMLPFIAAVKAIAGDDPVHLVIEARLVTDRLPGGTYRIFQMGRETGTWHTLASLAGYTLREIHPATWRKVAFASVRPRPVGSMQWKRLELSWCRQMTGARLIPTTKTPKSDHKIYGVAAAFGIFCAALKLQEGTGAKPKVTSRRASR